MPNPLADEARAIPDDELTDAINEARRELFNLQFQRGTRQLQNPMALRAARRQVARLYTIRNERARALAAGVPLAPLTRPSAPPPQDDQDDVEDDIQDAPQQQEQPEDSPSPDDQGDEPTAEAQDEAPQPAAADDSDADNDQPTAAADAEPSAQAETTKDA